MYRRIISLVLVVLFFLTPTIYQKLSDCELYENLKYGDAERQAVDIAFPEKTSEKMGLILYIHGGGFVSGDKSDYRNRIKSVCKKGFVCASVNYRYASSETDIFDIMDDITAALKVVKNKAAEKNIKLEKALITGISAGAHIALLYAYSRVEEAPIKPAAVVSYCASTDLSLNDMFYKTTMGTPENMAKIFSNVCGYQFDLASLESAVPALQKASPLYYVTENSVPTIICHGKRDDMVPISNAEVLDKKLDECGVEHHYVIFPNSGHGLSGDKICSEISDIMFMNYARKYTK